jgi:hypothetical protein
MPGAHFYCYIVADRTPALEQQALRLELEKTPDGQGFFGYKKHYKAYVEFISYTKLVTDAKQRNLVFFEKLGLPSILKSEPMTAQPSEEPAIPSSGFFQFGELSDEIR